MAAREAWTDERLDDLNKKVDDGFRELREELRTMNGHIIALHRTMLQLFGGMIATMLFGFLGVIATILTQT